MDLSKIREDYVKAALGESDVASSPFDQFGKWFEQAVHARMHTVNAMTLATVGADHKPSARIVLLKGFDERGFVFFTNYSSRKGRQLTGFAHAALLFFWPELEREIRIEGPVTRTDAAESDEYYASRPLGARLGAWASPQSDVLPDREALEQRLKDVTSKYGEQPPRPPHWGGFRLDAQEVEFWQGRSNRLHDRLRYRRQGAGWVIDRLAP